VILCDLTTCYSIDGAWFQRWNLKCDELLSDFAFDFHLRRCTVVTIQEQDPIMSLCLSADSRFLLVNLLSQEIHLWDISGDSSAPVCTFRVGRCRLTPG